MTPQEKQLLDDFLTRLAAVPQIRKDRAAAAAIDAAFARQPNAAYLVVQRALLLQQALDDAQAELARLKAAGNAASACGEPVAFLGPDAWGRREPEARPVVAGAADLSAGRSAAASGGMGGFLGQAAAIAAGVAGGAFLFQGLQPLLNRSDAAPGATFPDDATGLESGAADAAHWDAAVDGIAGGDFLA